MTNIIRRRPMTEFMGLRNDMDRFLSDAFRSFFDEGYHDKFHFRPAVDMEESGDKIIISAELPGIKKEDIKISIMDNKVVISGEINEEKNVEETNYYLKERVRGKFSRSFTLPSPVDSNKVEANYRNGILSLTLPKAEEAKPKQIEIQSD
ncbi:Hsp20/alpha crystallin family protein [Candidatus Contubernalis alkaliaceticus]|uniref:Hsp20/alpha crystallin family protein n=1 Tax=Candidatus Contubernalis alkaliaceticus TaxID=338645 RepID=UPI001F4C52A2|nr:Hsp20/alpha crystallin family protein [Candidatus Contubernalis alkalaceticus]UNC91795.1 Hsp20/alpha crystallin family protein [Candidatus Contubernalis alkalaceticus]